MENYKNEIRGGGGGESNRAKNQPLGKKIGTWSQKFF